MNPSPAPEKRPRLVSKKCPWCMVYLPLDAKVCHACQKRVGPVDRMGMAKKPVDVKAYVMAAVAVTLLIAYLKWAFF